MNARMWLVVAVAALLATACASAAREAPTLGMSLQQRDVHRDVHVDVTLTSGDRIPGSAADQEISISSERGRAAIPLSRVRAIDRNADAETVTVTMADGERRRCVLETETIDVLPMGALSPQRYATAHVRALRVTPRVRIAGSGDAWWDIKLVDALGFDVAGRDGRLTVERIDPAVVNRGNGGTWSTVKLSRDVAPLDDFDLSARIAWDAGGAGPRAMQDLSVKLLDAAGYAVACVGHHDAWTAVTGARYSLIGGEERSSGYGTQPAAGCADLRIVRERGRLRVLWDGCEIRSGESRTPVTRVVVQADYYAYRSAGSESVFGTATIERLELR